MLNEQNRPYSACIRCKDCDGFPCLVYAKADAQVICVDPALAHENVSLVTGARVTRLETSPSGREARRALAVSGGTPPRRGILFTHAVSNWRGREESARRRTGGLP